LSESATANWRARALIDARALCHNLGLARRLAPGCRVMAVVKSNAYGHGLTEVVRAIGDGVDALAVATLQEGVDCRAASPDAAVAILSGLQRPDDLTVCAQQRLQPVLHDEEHLQWAEQCDAVVRRLNLWLKIDTGMNRLGIAPAKVADAVARLRRCGARDIRLMSHLGCADDASDGYTGAQLQRFRRATDGLNMQRSLANSAAVMQCPGAHFDWVRPGVMLYGGSPLLGRRADELDLQPAMHLQARLITVKSVRQNESIGYGRDFTARRAMRIGVVGFGYGDGYPRVVDRGDAAPAALINGKRAPLVGRVSMDMLTVDLSAHTDARIGDVVTLWGDGLGVDEAAAWAGTIGYELLCKISERVARRLINFDATHQPTA